MKVRSQILTEQKQKNRIYTIGILAVGMMTILWLSVVQPHPLAATALQQETATETPSETPGETPAVTGTITPTISSTESVTATLSPTSTETPTGTPPTAAPTFTPTPTSTTSPLNTSTATPSFTPPPSPLLTPAVPPTPESTQVVAPAVLNFTVDRGAVADGESSVLTWKLARADSATLLYNGVEETLDPTGGSMLISPLDTTVYVLRARGAGGEVGSELTVVVNTPTPTVPPTPTDPLAPEIIAATATTGAQETIDAAAAVLPTEIPTNAPVDTPPPTPTAIVVAQSGEQIPPPAQPQPSPTPTLAALVLDAQSNTQEPTALSAQAEMALQNQLAWNAYVRKITLYGVATLGVVVPAILLILGVLIAGVWRET